MRAIENGTAKDWMRRVFTLFIISSRGDLEGRKRVDLGLRRLILARDVLELDESSQGMQDLISCSHARLLETFQEPVTKLLSRFGGLNDLCKGKYC